MIRNFLILALRRMKRDVFFSAINVVGLTVGVTAFLLLTLYVRHELSFDKFHTQDIQVLTWKFFNPRDGEVLSENFTVKGAHLLSQRVPELEKMTQFREVATNLLVSANEVSFYEGSVHYADANFFEVFDFAIEQGLPQLGRPGTAVITRRTAERYFGNQNPIGETIEVEKTGIFEVTAVVANVPFNSHIKYDILISNYDLINKELKEGHPGRQWGSVSANYFVFPEGTDAAGVLSKIFEVVKTDFPESYKDAEGEAKETISFFPYKDIHLKSGFGWAQSEVSSVKYVYLFACIALLILMIACINYINLVTARSLKRGKEIGLRKVVGASRRSVISQQLVESVLLTFVSVAVAFAMTERLLPYYSNLIERKLSFSYSDPVFLPALIVFSLVLGVLAGIYPALKLSAYNPLHAFRGGRGPKSKASVRRGLVFFQFFVAQGLIITTVIIQGQLSYLQNKSLGYDREHVLYINTYSELGEAQPAFKQELNNISGISTVAFSNDILLRNGLIFFDMADVEDNENAEEGAAVTLDFFSVDDQYIKAMGMKMVAGESFDFERNGYLEGSIILNESAVKKFGWENAVGKRIKFRERNLTVVGVVKDFHNESLKTEVQPAMLIANSAPQNYVSIRVMPQNVKATVDQIEAVWDAFVPERPMTFQFYDDYYDAQYRSEVRLGKIFYVFSGIAISISVLGLIGLTVFAAEQRLKEISIRKVFGAKVSQLMYLLSQEFIWLLIISFVLVSPITFYFMEDWLEAFVYRININLAMYVLAIGVTLLIAICSVSFQSSRVARANPAETLRNE